MSLRKMAKPETKSDGPLDEMEMHRAAGLLHRAVMHGQAHGLVKMISGHIHGRPVTATCSDVLEQIQGMNDSSKRRFDYSDTEETGSWDEVSSNAFMDRLHGCHGDQPSASGVRSQAAAGYDHGSVVTKEKPKTQAEMLQQCQELTRHNVPYPKGIASVMDWGRTVITMKKYSHMKISYAELVEIADADEDAMKYLAWIQATFMPTLADLNKDGKRTQARDLALYLKKIGWSKTDNEEFCQTLK